MDNNPELELAWQFIEKTGTHLFLTGKAGTGKTTFLKDLKEKSLKRMVVLAPTGIAAINAGGVTIHSFFQLSFAPFIPETTFVSAQTHYRFSKEKRNIIRSMDLLVIDEISMVRADLLDAIDAALRRFKDRNKPFGGVQLLMIGDLQQLAPVVKDNEWELLKKYYDSAYFFASNALKQTSYMTIELKKVYRQNDEFFLSLLNKIRENKADESVLNELNRRYIPGFQPRKEEGYIRLTTHNYQSQQVNDRELALLPGKSYSFRAQIEKNFPEYSFPADEVLTLKEGAQIMFLKNDNSGEKRFYNGMIGDVISVNESSITVCGKGNKQPINLLPEEWQNTKYVLDEQTKEITEEVEGVFKQYPIRLAWAITIHKSQGLTFEHAIIDAQNSFAHGQTYVALSRCKTLEGLVLETPLRREAIISDSIVDDFTKKAEEHVPGNKQLYSLQKAYFFDLLCDLFNFYSLEQAYKRLLRFMDEEIYKLYPKKLAQYKEIAPHIEAKIIEVSNRFRTQYTRLIEENEDYEVNEALQSRIISGSAYFLKELQPIRLLFDQTHLPLDNKELKKQLNERLQSLGDALFIKESLLGFMSEQEFTVTDYLKEKAKTLLTLETDTGKKAKSSAKGSKERKSRKDRTSNDSTSSETEVSTDILYPQLYHALSAWRTEKARELQMPPYFILKQKVLLGIVNLLPETTSALSQIEYFGAKSVEKYGQEILKIVHDFKKKQLLKQPMQSDSISNNLAIDNVPDKDVVVKEKIDTKQMSFEMFCEGMSIEEIAQKRDFVTGTIARHLEYYLSSGELHLEQLVTGKKIEIIRQYLNSHEFTGIVAIKAALGDKVSYEDIRFVLLVTKH